MQRLRRLLGLDADALAGRAQLGLDVLCELETGKREPTYGELHDLAVGFGMTMDDVRSIAEYFSTRETIRVDSATS